MAEIIKKGTVPSRIKFMLMDVQDLRANNWVQRSRQESSLKTIDQVYFNFVCSVQITLLV